MSKIKKIYLDLCMCSVFRSVFEKPLFKYFSDFVKASVTDEKIKAYANMVAETYLTGGSLTDAVKRVVFEDENPYVRFRAQGREIPTVMEEAVKRELSAFHAFSSLSVKDFGEELKTDSLSAFTSYDCDLAVEYEERMKNIRKHGYGIFSYHPMFRLDDGRNLCPILSPDKTTLDSFIGYESERALVVENTVAFIGGKPALNALLYGDAGTGKSSTVKALINEFFDEGLRLIELRKDQLAFLPEIMGRISENPLKFIIFIDDLSFNKNDDNFSMLKAALEGSASAKAENALIYATSNRRHIVKETFDDRDGGDVHRNDTMQEKLSLSERFGLAVSFFKPSKQLYLEIVTELARRNGVHMDKKELDLRAEEFALRRGNRSARCEEQFIKSLL